MIDTLINPEIEEALKNTILPQLDLGRKNFDRPHTEAVVHWMKEMLINDKALDSVDSLVMITAAYAHDWGYIGLFDGVDSDNPAEINKRKPLHMEKGAEMITNLIESQLSEYFTEAQKKLVAHLVLVHDKVEDLRTDEEILIMEADTLGMLDADMVKPTFSKLENANFISDQIHGRRLPAFTHQVAIDAASPLIQKRLAFYA